MPPANAGGTDCTPYGCGYYMTALRASTSFRGAVVDGVSFIDCIFRGVRSTEVVEASGSIVFRNVEIEPAENGRSVNSRPTWP